MVSSKLSSTQISFFRVLSLVFTASNQSTSLEFSKPLYTGIKHLILIAYFLQHSVLRNCRPTMRPFKATKMNLLFLFLLALMLALACVVIGYVIINEKRSVMPWYISYLHEVKFKTTATA